MIKAIAFGAIGSVAETSDVQRRAFNAAFAEAGLPWKWDEATYRNLLAVNGGRNRIRFYRDQIGSTATMTEDVIIELHQAKASYFERLMVTSSISPRPGVVGLLQQCKSRGIKTAFCTSTSQANVNAIERAIASDLDFGLFDIVVSLDHVSRPKPAPDAYLYALEKLNVSAAELIAIEDAPVSIAAAKAAGLYTIATPGAATAGQDFSQADMQVDRLDLLTWDELVSHQKVDHL